MSQFFPEINYGKIRICKKVKPHCVWSLGDQQGLGDNFPFVFGGGGTFKVMIEMPYSSLRIFSSSLPTNNTATAKSCLSTPVQVHKPSFSILILMCVLMEAFNSIV